MKSRKLIAALAWAGAAFLFGMALGERGELGAVQYFFLGGIPLATAVLAHFSRHARIEVLLAGLSMFLGLVAGRSSFARAYEECFTAAPLVRVRIERHYAEHEEFPERLDDLPCQCPLRGSILHYAQNERGYRLWFTNDFRTWTAKGSAAALRRRDGA